ncbi:hypothetical protein [Robbsia andropogonis]|uniref:hypothetical protein n=1 Tax=Robbsia andropogonis TaxID=28092 RepID=UPI0012F85D34|nr:hypothetical protein [Robbsia andropogonis]MCP1116845.1 hypothetical protein [Robbsia andropogonis]MCP1126476.1 hypothetical protein [Robbsia andropogonis]
MKTASLRRGPVRDKGKPEGHTPPSEPVSALLGTFAPQHRLNPLPRHVDPAFPES